ncbi:MAG: SIR2 family protein [Myxococcales bacterium]|nr:SIR2 family protein [Myxococcales bacterium]
MTDAWTRLRSYITLPDGKTLVVPVLGAGLSRQAGLPLFDELATRLTEALAEINPEAANYQRRLVSENVPIYDRMEQLRNELQDARFRQLVVEMLSSPRVEKLDVHRAIAQFQPEVVVTTNLDRTFEIACDSVGTNWIHVLPPDFTPPALDSTERQNSTKIVKIHGDIEAPSTWVLTSSAYKRTYLGKTPYIEAIQRYTRSRILMFVGYSLADTDLVFAIAQLATEEWQTQGGHFVFAPRNEYTTVLRDRVNQVNAFPILYDPDQHHSALREKLLELFAHSTEPDDPYLKFTKEILTRIERMIQGPDNRKLLLLRGKPFLVYAVLSTARERMHGPVVRIDMRLREIADAATRHQTEVAISLGSGTPIGTEELSIMLPVHSVDRVKIVAAAAEKVKAEWILWREAMLQKLSEDLSGPAPDLKQAVRTAEQLWSDPRTQDDDLRAGEVALDVASRFINDHVEAKVGKTYAELAVRRFRSAGDKRQEVRAILTQARADSRMGRSEEAKQAITTLRAAFKRFTEEPNANAPTNLRLQIELLQQEATTLRLAGRLDDSQTAIYEAIKRGEQLLLQSGAVDDEILHLTSRQESARLLLAQSRFVNGVDAFWALAKDAEQLEQRAQDSSDQRNLGRARWHRIIALGLTITAAMDAGLHDDARNAHDELKKIDLAPVSAAPVMQAYIHLWTGMVFEIDGALKAAHAAYAQSERLFRTLSDQLGLIQARHLRTSLDARLHPEAWVDVLAELREVNVTAAEIGLAQQALESLLACARALLASQRTNQATEVADEIQQLIQKRSRKKTAFTREISALHQALLGEIALNRRDFMTARKHLHAAVHSATRADFPPVRLAEIIRALAQVERMVGQVGVAHKHYSKVLDYSRLGGARSMEAQALTALAELLRYQGHLAEALTHVQAAMHTLSRERAFVAERTADPSLEPLLKLEGDAQLGAIHVLSQMGILDQAESRAQELINRTDMKTAAPAAVGKAHLAIADIAFQRLDRLKQPISSTNVEPLAASLEKGIDLCLRHGATSHGGQAIRVLVGLYLELARKEPSKATTAIQAAEGYFNHYQKGDWESALMANAEAAFHLTLSGFDVAFAQNLPDRMSDFVVEARKQLQALDNSPLLAPLLEGPESLVT